MKRGSPARSSPLSAESDERGLNAQRGSDTDDTDPSDVVGVHRVREEGSVGVSPSPQQVQRQVHRGQTSSAMAHSRHHATTAAVGRHSGVPPHRDADDPSSYSSASAPRSSSTSSASTASASDGSHGVVEEADDDDEEDAALGSRTSLPRGIAASRGTAMSVTPDSGTRLSPRLSSPASRTYDVARTHCQRFAQRRSGTAPVLEGVDAAAAAAAIGEGGPLSAAAAAAATTGAVRGCGEYYAAVSSDHSTTSSNGSESDDGGLRERRQRDVARLVAYERAWNQPQRPERSVEGARVASDEGKQSERSAPSHHSSGGKRGEAPESAEDAVGRQHSSASQAGSTSTAAHGSQLAAHLIAEPPDDPRYRVIRMIVESDTGSVPLALIHDQLDWANTFEPTYGTVQEYLHGYHTIFVVSPVEDTVSLVEVFVNTIAAQASSTRGAPRGKARGRRRGDGKPHLNPAAVVDASRRIGSVSYSCVADAFDLVRLEEIYRRRGYGVEMLYGVLHVSSPGVFDLYVFAYGVLVWWGMNRRDHWMVEDDYLAVSSSSSSSAVAVAGAITERYSQKDIDTLFPDWVSYEEDAAYSDALAVPSAASAVTLRADVVDAAVKRFAQSLPFDHYRIPKREPARSQVMLTLSHCLGRTARVDYFEYITRWSHQHVLGIPSDFTGLLDYFSTKRKIERLAGELHVAQLAITTLKDSPEFLWEMPWLETFYQLADEQNSTAQRLSWFSARSDALLEQLSNIKARRFRLFMLGSDVFLIVLLILDVIFMTSRLVVKLYFKVEED